jgi:hypothetical protein
MQIISAILEGLVITVEFGKAYGIFTYRNMNRLWAPIFIRLTITGQCCSELIGLEKNMPYGCLGPDVPKILGELIFRLNLC